MCYKNHLRQHTCEKQNPMLSESCLTSTKRVITELPLGFIVTLDVSTSASTGNMADVIVGGARLACSVWDPEAIGPNQSSCTSLQVRAVSTCVRLQRVLAQFNHSFVGIPLIGTPQLRLGFYSEQTHLHQISAAICHCRSCTPYIQRNSQAEA